MTVCGTVDLNLLSWSAASNVVALALYRSVYLWNAANGSITELCEIPTADRNDYYSSVSFMPSTTDSILALGNSLGSIQVLHTVTVIMILVVHQRFTPLHQIEIIGVMMTVWRVKPWFHVKIKLF